MQELPTITPEVLAGAAGGLVSLVIFVLAAFSTKVRNMTDEQLQVTNLGAIALVTVVVGLLSCLSELGFVSCSQLGIYELARMGAAAAIANVTTFASTKHIARRAMKAVGGTARE